MLKTDESFMVAALELAGRGRGRVEPNPMVGAVLVKDGVEVGRGWHKEFGGAHAEIEALAAARSGGADIRGATMYVTLEPCCHHGKTPPCTDALIEAGIARVVIGMEDPDAQVRGRGIAALRQAGIEVSVGVMEEQVRKLLLPYIKLRTRGLPWVICKWAQTADGLIALPPGSRRWISGPEARDRAHWLRGLCDGVCVGIGTVLADDPLLTNRSGRGKQPSRLVLDSKLRTPLESQLVRTADYSPVIVATTAKAVTDSGQQAGKLREAGVELLELAEGERGVDLQALLEELGRRQWTHLLVEGGTKVLDSFVYHKLADELLVFVAPQELPEAGEDLPRFDLTDVKRRLGLDEPHDSHRYGEDTLLHYLLRE
jgi:diaminohydroxyphosphoribosylaminopyrimidine deaminase/5-amino-6-(5-phosphoribosylamino)uracil reductase